MGGMRKIMRSSPWYNVLFYTWSRLFKQCPHCHLNKSCDLNLVRLSVGQIHNFVKKKNDDSIQVNDSIQVKEAEHIRATHTDRAIKMKRVKKKGKKNRGGMSESRG